MTLTNQDCQILVVDDSESFAQMISDLLTRKGYRVTTASSAEEGLKFFQRTDFDIVLTDIILPGISGLNLLKVMKETRPETDVIIVSGNDSSYTAIKALRLGAYDFIVKPIDDEAILYNVVERTLERQELTRQNRILIGDLCAKNAELGAALKLMHAQNRICARIASSTEAAEILRLLVEQGVEELGARTGYLLLMDREEGRFSMKVSVGVGRSLAQNFRLAQGTGISGLVASEKTPMRTDERPPSDLTHRLLQEDLSGELFSAPGILSAPLMMKGKVVGVLTISGRASGIPFSGAELEFLTGLTAFGAIALENAGNFYRLKKGHS